MASDRDFTPEQVNPYDLTAVAEKLRSRSQQQRLEAGDFDPYSLDSRRSLSRLSGDESGDWLRRG